MALVEFKERFYPQWAPSATAAVFSTGLRGMQLAACLCQPIASLLCQCNAHARDMSLRSFAGCQNKAVNPASISTA